MFRKNRGLSTDRVSNADSEEQCIFVKGAETGTTRDDRRPITLHAEYTVEHESISDLELAADTQTKAPFYYGHQSRDPKS